MSKISQKEAVFQAISKVLGEGGVEFVEGSDVKSLMTRERRAQVSAILLAGFQGQSIQSDKEFADEAELKSYVSGLQSNWIRKDTRLNGSVAYKAKNPGSRAGSADPQLKALRTLLKTQTDESARAEIEGYINTRLAELNVSKAPAVDLSALPAELAAKYSN